MKKPTRVTVAAVFLTVLIMGVLGYFWLASAFFRPIQKEKWHEVVILGIDFINNSSNPATKGTYNLYAEGEHGLWDCRTPDQETGYFKIRIWNTGSAGHVYSSILVGLTEYDHWEGDLADEESITWTTLDFSSGSYSYPGFSNFTVRAYDTSTSPWTITDEQTVTVECISAK
jgi:hypothetical protein